MVIPVLPSLDHFIGIKVLLVLVNSLLRTIIPAGIHPLLAVSILPRAIDLRNDGFGHIVWVLNMDPVTDLPQLVVV